MYCNYLQKLQHANDGKVAFQSDTAGRSSVQLFWNISKNWQTQLGSLRDYEDGCRKAKKNLK